MPGRSTCSSCWAGAAGRRGSRPADSGKPMLLFGAGTTDLLCLLGRPGRSTNAATSGHCAGGGGRHVGPSILLELAVRAKHRAGRRVLSSQGQQLALAAIEIDRSPRGCRGCQRLCARNRITVDGPARRESRAGLAGAPRSHFFADFVPRTLTFFEILGARPIPRRAKSERPRGPAGESAPTSQASTDAPDGRDHAATYVSSFRTAEAVAEVAAQGCTSQGGSGAQLARGRLFESSCGKLRSRAPPADSCLPGWPVDPVTTNRQAQSHAGSFFRACARFPAVEWGSR